MRDATRARAHIQHPAHLLRIDPGREPRLDQLGDGRARDQHAFVHIHGQAGEPAAMREVDHRHALADAPRHQAVEALSRCRAQRLV